METVNPRAADNTERSPEDQYEQDIAAPASGNSSERQEDEQNLDQAQSRPKSKSSTVTKDSKKKTKPKTIFNVSDTKYPVVRYVGKKMMGFKLTKDLEVEWDLFWTDNAVNPETLAKMQPYQKINHFPGMYSLARKNHLGRNLMRMKRAFPKEFKFFPQTFLLPAEYNDFKQQFATKKPVTFIVKPEASCQGRGIFLTKTFEDVEPGEHYVAQRYLDKPFLLEGLKFDLRIYVLLAGCDPLRIYLFDDGLGRFATEEYTAPSANNMDNMCMHLTNYAINKDNPNFVFNESTAQDDVGHKRSLKAVLRQLEELGHDVKKLWNSIKKIIIKTFCGVQPIIAHAYKSCQPDEPYNNMCFEILGFDIILDHKLKPWLLEVNHTPSFTTDTPLDKTIKRNVIRDALQLMNISANHRIKYKNKKKAEFQERVLTGKKAKLTLEEKQAAFAKAQKERDAWESKNLGGYEKIYPFDNPSQAEENYEEFMRVAHKWWEEWTGTAPKKNIKKSATDVVNGTMNSAQAASKVMVANMKAKQVQSGQSDRVKLTPINQRSPSKDKPRESKKVVEVEKKQDDSLQEELSDKVNMQLNEVTPSSKSCEMGLQTTDASEDLNFINRFKIVGEDEKDDMEYRALRRDRIEVKEVPKGEKNHSIHELAAEGVISVIDAAQTWIYPSESSSQREIGIGQPKVIVAEKKNSLATIFKEPSYSKPVSRPGLGMDNKENPTGIAYEKNVTSANQQKFPPIYLKSSPITLSKLPENQEEDSFSTKRSLLHKLPIKSVTRIYDETGNTEGPAPSDFLANQSGKSLAQNHGENIKVAQIDGNDWNTKSYTKRIEPLAHKPKNPPGTYLVPKMFELSVKTAKSSTSYPKQKSLHSGLTPASRGLVRGVQTQALGYMPEAPANSYQGNRFTLQSKK